MELREVRIPGRQLVDSYLPGGFRVGGILMRGPLLVRPEEAVSWPLADPAAPTAQDLAMLQADAAAGLEILVLGLGPRHVQLSPALRQTLRGWGLGVDAMTTPAACRTYNILAGEGRRVAAALLPMP